MFSMEFKYPEIENKIRHIWIRLSQSKNSMTVYQVYIFTISLFIVFISQIIDNKEIAKRF